MTPHRHKIGAPLRAAIEMTDAEWAAYDPVAAPVTAAVNQGGVRHPFVATPVPARKAVALTLDTAALQRGHAVMDAWIGDEAVPAGQNVALEFIHGASRGPIP